jgi:deoxyribose-phosphate aldolase
MNWILENFPLPASFNNIDSEVKAIKERSVSHSNDVAVLENIFNCIDLTSLNSTDSSYSITEFVDKVNKFESQFPGYKNVAAICVFPVFAPVLSGSLRAKGVKKAVVSAGFPSSQTFSDLKVLETKKALDFGANEIDIVISVGEFLDGNYEFVADEIIAVKQVTGENVLKVIIESGAMRDAKDVWIATLLSVKSGAGFVKTSTGKITVGATHQAALVICTAIKQYYQKTGKKVGFKASGGVASVEDALVYYQIVKEVLGDEWLNNNLFRIGASRLANALMTKLVELKDGRTETINYF